MLAVEQQHSPAFARTIHEGLFYMAETVRNDSLGNFATNRDQVLGKAIAEAASALSNNIQKSDQLIDSAVNKITRNKKTNQNTTEKQ